MFNNKLSDIPNIKEVLQLADILKKNGDKVLNGSTKLTLSTKLLNNLNNSFTLIIDDSKDFESSFQVCNNSEIDLFRNLKFLHDFVQKVISLKIINTLNLNEIPVDLTKFRHLKCLELQKVCIDLVNGIQRIRGQLEYLSCTGAGGISTIGRLLSCCGGDGGIGFIWASLKHLSLSYNGLGRLDKSLELAPWLQTLDLSHNFISIANELECLPNLKCLNLGFNKLECIPKFNKSANRTLHVLILKNNYIDNLDGLQYLDSLVELDISNNCIVDHSDLSPLETLSGLLRISIEGNPISYHYNHRMLTLKYLHPSLVESQFNLDHRPLNKSEKHFIVKSKLLFTTNYKTSFSTDNSNPISKLDIINSSINSEINNSFTSSISETSSNFTENFNTKNKKKKTYVQEVNIDDYNDENKQLYSYNNKNNNLSYDNDKNDINNINYQILSSSIESNQHLEMKKKIFELRAKFGNDNWLTSHSGTSMQDIMGIQQFESNFNNLNQVKQDSLISQIEINNSNQIINNDNNKGTDDSMDSSIVNENECEEKSILNKNIYDTESETGKLFIVKKNKNTNCKEMEEIFLTITPNDIKERNSLTGEIKYSWSMDIVLSCIIGSINNSSTIDFTFDTTRRDRKYRMYFVNNSDAQTILKLINNYLKNQPLSLQTFKCIKCSTHFSHDSKRLSINIANKDAESSIVCPFCECTLVIKCDELSKSDCFCNKINVENELPSKIKADEYVSSIDSIKNTPDIIDVTSTLQHSTSQSSIGSATSLNDSRESTPSTAIKKSESDIEVLSNPSQSSIEVLDEGTKSLSTPQRKQSSQKFHIDDSTLSQPITVGLTESSSSGSLTDSICTTYENQRSEDVYSQQHYESDNKEEPYQRDVSKDLLFPAASNLPLMLEGLLQGMSIGTDNDLNARINASSQQFLNKIQYSYTNFTNLDHRIKLHLVLNVFELENEELVLFLRSEILLETQTQTFSGCIVLSTSKMYILRITGAENEDPHNWLIKELSWTIDRLRKFSPLPYKQGIVIELEQPNKLTTDGRVQNFIITCVLQDFQRTSNLLLYLMELSLPEGCEVDFGISEHSNQLIRNLMISSKFYQSKDNVRIFTIFSSAVMKFENQHTNLRIGGLLITTSTIILIDDKFDWLLICSDNSPAKLREQAISNLIEVTNDENAVELYFIDEIAGVEEYWMLEFISVESATGVINAIQSPWEELFTVPLQIISKKNRTM